MILELPPAPTEEAALAILEWLKSWIGFFTLLTTLLYPYFLTCASLLRGLMAWLEPILVKRNPPTPTSRFWGKWAIALMIVEKISWAGPRDNGAIRTLEAWKRKRDTLDPVPEGGDQDAK